MFSRQNVNNYCYFHPKPKTQTADNQNGNGVFDDYNMDYLARLFGSFSSFVRSHNQIYVRSIHLCLIFSCTHVV